MISRMSLVAALAVAALVPTSALARPASHAARHDLRVAERLTDPAVQARASAMAAIMSERLLDVRVGPLARAIGEWGDPELRDVPYDARVRDFAGPGLRELPGDIAREMPRAMGQMGRTAGAIEGMIPEFERMAEQMRRAIDRADRRADRYSEPHDY